MTEPKDPFSENLLHLFQFLQICSGGRPTETECVNAISSLQALQVLNIKLRENAHRSIVAAVRRGELITVENWAASRRLTISGENPDEFVVYDTSTKKPLIFTKDEGQAVHVLLLHGHAQIPNQPETKAVVFHCKSCGNLFFAALNNERLKNYTSDIAEYLQQGHKMGEITVPEVNRENWCVCPESKQTCGPNIV